MIPCKILFFDLDGTLLLSDHRNISDATKDALHRAHAAGIRLVVATGRSLSLLPESVLDLPFDYYLTSNGADILDTQSKAHVFTAFIPPEDAALAWNVLKDMDMFIEWYASNEIAVDAATYAQLQSAPLPWWHNEYFAKKTSPVFPSAEAYIASGAPGLEKLNMPRCGAEKRDAAWAALSTLGRFALSSSGGRNIEVNTLGCTKGHAIEALCEILHIPIEEAAAFGDGGNDIEMLQTVGIGIAMGNGGDAAKAAARYITHGNDDEGISSFILEHLL